MLWSPMELDFAGPSLDEADVAPNPFLDFRLQVLFQAPSGKTLNVPGFFDGDGLGGSEGDVWKARFSPDEVGAWSWMASFRMGNDVAVSIDPTPGSPTAFDGSSGVFQVAPPSPTAEGFLSKGRLRYVGEHYLRFQDGSYFLKTGTNSPENFLAYRGFDDVLDTGGLGILHDYAAHVADWVPGDPSLGTPGYASGLKGIVGALNYLSSEGVNAVYFLPMNLGGDGQDTTPFLGYTKSVYDKTHYDLSRLAQWNTVFEHATRKGIQLQFVLSETEPENETWLDDGGLGVERKLFFRELAARFSHNLAIKWNLGEENDYDVWLLGLMADYLRFVDPYDHPIGVHTHADDFSDYEQLLGDPRFSITSIQYTNALAGPYVEDWRAMSAAAGVPWVLDLDENGTPEDGVSDTNAAQFRKEVLYDVLLSGGGVEWYLGAQPPPLGGDQSLEDFRTREEIWRYSRQARELLETFAFWEMEPADQLLTGESDAWGGGEVLALPDREYAIYLPDASQTATLSIGGPTYVQFELRWFNPRKGVFEGDSVPLQGGGPANLGAPPSDPDEDWVATIHLLPFSAFPGEVSVSGEGGQTLFLDGGPERAGHDYLILGSLTGTAPGFWVDGLWIPLNYDAWTVYTLDHPFGPLTFDFVGVLDGIGQASALIDFAELGSAALVGLTLHHVFLAGASGLDLSSNAVPMTLTP